jgi:hypothetical protein
MKLRLTASLLTTFAAVAANSGHSSDQMETVTVTAQRPHTVAAKKATSTLSAAEEAMNRYFTQDGLASGVSNLWVYPTNDRDSVFVQYELREPSGSRSQHQLAIIELNGTQITRLVGLAGVPATRVASAASGR